MVRQPAYLVNLKAYAKSRYGSDADIAASVADLSAESDRGAIIIAASQVEDMLEYPILQQMPALSEDETARKQLFEQDGAIASFSRKIAIAYAMGIIDKPYRKLIDIARETRNACAHSRKPLSLETPELQAICKVLIADMLDDIVDHTPITLRRATILKCTVLAHYVVTGEKLEGMEAQVRHYKKMTQGA